MDISVGGDAFKNEVKTNSNFLYIDNSLRKLMDFINVSMTDI